MKSFKQGYDMIKCVFCKDDSGSSSSIKGWREKAPEVRLVLQARDRYLGFELRKWQQGQVGKSETCQKVEVLGPGDQLDWHQEKRSRVRVTPGF